MNVAGKLLIIDSTDIREQSSNKKSTEIGITDLRQQSLKALHKADVAIVILSFGPAVVLKNRWSNDGVVVPRSYYEKIVSAKNENNKSNNSTKSKRFLGRIFKNIWPFNRS